MKPRKANDLRELTDEEIIGLHKEAQETLSSQRFQHSLSQLQDSAYLNVLKKDIARIITIIKERNLGN